MSDVDDRSIWLHPTTKQCPIYWQNFINDFDRNNFLKSFIEFQDIRKTLYNEYNASYFGVITKTPMGDRKEVRFNTPEDLLYFKLRWS